MNIKIIVISTILISLLFPNDNIFGSRSVMSGKYDIEKDLLLVQFDCKTDVDDLHTVAAFRTLMANEEFSAINYHAVAGTYGMQEGLYVPPNELFQLAFDDNWTDAHNNWSAAVEKVKILVVKTLEQDGDIWIADAGQSDFSADLVQAVQRDLPDLDTSKRFHVVQHAEWNEQVTTPEKLDFVKQHTDYIKIPDGNGVGNGTPGFRSAEFTEWKKAISNPILQNIWQLAIDLGNTYNGKDDRYLNEAIEAGGLDFSDLSEVCWILGLEDIKDVEEYFNLYTK